MRGISEVMRTIPDVRSSNVDKTIRFYTDFLGFTVRRQGDRVTGFVSTNDPDRTRDFYVELFGFEVGWERDAMVQLRSPVSGKAELIVTSSTSDTGGPGKGFDLGVGTIERLETLHRAATGNWIVMGQPE